MKKNYVMVTGASSGIGASCCEYLSAKKERIILVGRNSSNLTKVASKLSGSGHLTKIVDMEDEQQVIDLVGSLKNEGIKLNGLICSTGSHQVKPLRICKKDDYQNLFSSNVLSITNILSRIGRLVNPGSGIVIVGSAGINRGASAVSAYAAAKSALDGLMRASAMELSAIDARVNVVAPGVVKTNMTKVFLKKIGEDASNVVINRHPLGLGEPSDVAALVSFLVSSEARWITGQTIVIDGGFSISG